MSIPTTESSNILQQFDLEQWYSVRVSAFSVGQSLVIKLVI